jgi:HK97 family phage portal protein
MFSAVWAAVRVIAETVSMLPLHIFQREPGKGAEPEKNILRSDHAIDWLISTQPNPETDAGVFWESLIAHALTWGNGYAEKERDNADRIVNLWPITPDRVKPDRVNRTGRIIYDIHNPGGENTVLEQRDMLHIHGLGYDGMQGYSVIAMAAQSIGLSMAAEQFGAGFFGNGTEPGGVLEHPGKLSPTAYEHIKNSWAERHQGPANARKPAILEEGMKWTRLSVPPEDAQFLQTRKFQIAEIARWYRVPLHMLAELDRSTNNNIEFQGIEFVIHTIQPWATRIERAINTQLLGPQQRGKMYAKMSLQALLRGDTAARGAFYRELFNMGAMSPNEIRALEEMNPVPGGNKRFVQLNLTTLERAGEQPEPAAQPAPGGLNGTKKPLPAEQNQPENVH